MVSSHLSIQDFAIIGIGMNRFRLLVPILDPLFMISPYIDIAHAHNHMLQAGLELVILRLVAYLALWLDAAGMLWRAWCTSSMFWPCILALGLAVSLLAYFILE